jgi:hypothetical protein
MAEFGEWTRKGAVLSEGTAQKEYGVSREFILRGIKSGQLEAREGSGWGNPYFKILRSQIEAYIASEFGTEYLSGKKCQAELRAINKKITELKRTLAALEARKVELMELACKQSVTKQRKE